MAPLAQEVPRARKVVTYILRLLAPRQLLHIMLQLLDTIFAPRLHVRHLGLATALQLLCMALRFGNDQQLLQLSELFSTARQYELL